MLTPKKKAFIEERMKDKTASNTEIAKRAGYSPKTAKQKAYQISKALDVQQRISELGQIGLDALEERAKYSKNEIAQVQAGKTLVETAYGKPKDNPTNSFGDITINVNKLSSDLLRLTDTSVKQP